MVSPLREDTVVVETNPEDSSCQDMPCSATDPQGKTRKHTFPPYLTLRQGLKKALVTALKTYRESRRKPSKTTRSRSSYPWRSTNGPTIASRLARSRATSILGEARSSERGKYIYICIYLNTYKIYIYNTSHLNSEYYRNCNIDNIIYNRLLQVDEMIQDSRNSRFTLGNKVKSDL